MNCYQHQSNTAIGLCKSCQKAVCATCAKDTGKGLACCEACEKEVLETNQIIERSKLIYNISKKSKLPASGVIFYFILGLLFAVFGLSPKLTGESPQWFLLIMGICFLGFGVLLYVRTRKLNINC